MLAQLTILGQTASVPTWRKALERARTEGVKVYQKDGDWYTTSVSKPGIKHHVNGTCDCEAAKSNKLCKHLAAVRSAQLKRGELAKCDVCGYVGTLGTEVIRTLGWVGGRGPVERTMCSDTQACWARFDSQDTKAN